MGDTMTTLPVAELTNTILIDKAAVGLALKHPFFDQVSIRSIVSRPEGGAGIAGQRIWVGRWVKTGREQEKGIRLLIGCQRRVVPCESASCCEP
ncbi:unnamed protein product [Linum trigynum]|uniref:Uncharacterized protein n=1 Tax=Linum trigynum TaxID=586398 RepID=A0AAV2GEK8_9ROSI